MGEEAFERTQDKFFEPLLKTFQQKMMDISTIPTIEYTRKKLQMFDDFSQMMKQELRDIRELEYDDEGLIIQTTGKGRINLLIIL